MLIEVWQSPQTLRFFIILMVVPSGATIRPNAIVRFSLWVYKNQSLSSSSTSCSTKLVREMYRFTRHMIFQAPKHTPESLVFLYHHPLCQFQCLKMSPSTATKIYRATSMYHIRFYQVILLHRVKGFPSFIDQSCTTTGRLYGNKGNRLWPNSNLKHLRNNMSAILPRPWIQWANIMERIVITFLSFKQSKISLSLSTLTRRIHTNHTSPKNHI